MNERDGVWRGPELQAITDYAEDYISLFDLEHRHLFVNRAMADVLGKQPADFIGKTTEEAGMPADQARAWNEQLRQVAASGVPAKHELRIRVAQGPRALESLIAPIKDARGAVQALVAITRDVTEWKQAEALRECQHEVLRKVAAGAPLPELLQTMVALVEEYNPGRVCSILLLDDDSRRLRAGHAPGLPPQLVRAICGRDIGVDNAACGAAAAQMQRVICGNIADDPAWVTDGALALEAGLRACCSQPILDSEGRLLGTFALYFRKPRAPREAELLVLNEGALAAAVAIQSWRTRDRLLEADSRYRALTDIAANIVSVTDGYGVVRYVSPAIETILGYRPEEVLGLSAYEWVHPDDIAPTKKAFTELRQSVGNQVRALYRARHKDGSWRVLETVGKSQLDHQGQFSVVVSARDVSERENLLARISKSEERLERALAASGLGMWDWNVGSGEIFIDARCAHILGHPPEQIAPHVDSLINMIHPDDAVRVARAIEGHLRGAGDHYEYEARVLTAAQDWRWVRSRGSVTERDVAGEPLRVTGTIRDIDAQQRTQEKLDSATSRISLLLAATDEGILGLDPSGVCSFVNAAAARMLGRTHDEMLGRDFYELVRHTEEDSRELPRERSPILRCLQEGRRSRGHSLFWREDGQSFPVDYSVSPILADQRHDGAVLMFHDISEKRSLANQLHHQALHDPLTSLVNRRGFEAKLTDLLQNAKASHRQHAMCYLDLDHFKLVNDTCGHAAGDELLRQLPKVLQPLVRGRDTVARLGGDEFGILLEDCPLDKAAKIAESLREAVRGFRFVWQYRTFTVGVSIGVVGIGADSGGLASVLAAADTACYVAKDQGPNNVHVSYPHDLAIIRRRGEMRWVARLKQAMDENQFRLYYQTIAAVNAAVAGPPRSHEILIRLLDAKGELIPPGAFIPAAERYQLMPSIDAWVVENALRSIGEMLVPMAHLKGHKFGINLSADSLRDNMLLTTIRETVERYHVPPSMIYFEITETAAIANLGAALEFMEGLKVLGCELALDDFGSGMSSFSYLKNLPVDYLKIDGSFVKDIVHNPVDQAIVRAINSVAQPMGIKTIAEYVETDAIYQCLKEIGVDYAQGHAIARPEPLDLFPTLLAPRVARA